MRDTIIEIALNVFSIALFFALIYGIAYGTGFVAYACAAILFFGGLAIAFQRR